MNFGHEPTEVFLVVGQVVEIGGEEIEHAARWIKGCRTAGGSATCISGVQNHIQRLATTERNRVGVILQVVPRLIPQNLGVEANDLHRNPQRRQCLILGNVQVSDAQEGFSPRDRKSTRLNSSHRCISYAVFCLKKKKPPNQTCS